MKITTTAPKHLLTVPHQVGPNQGIPGHVPIHFYSAFLVPLQEPILRATCARAVSLCMSMCMCMYVQVYASIPTFLQVCAGMCLYLHIPEGMLDIFHHFLHLVSLDGSVVHSVICAPDDGFSSSSLSF